MEVKPLKIDREYIGHRTTIMSITGWTDEELHELGSMTYQDMKEKIMEVLDSRNGGIGTCWHNAYYIYQMWIHGDAVKVEIGNSSD